MYFQMSPEMACKRGGIIAINTIDRFAFIDCHPHMIFYIEIVYTQVIIAMNLFHQHHRIMLPFAYFFYTENMLYFVFWIG